MNNPKGKKSFKKVSPNKPQASGNRTTAKNAKAPKQPMFPALENLFNKPYSFPALLSLVYIILLLIVNPVGNFPLNDDWIYAKPVSILLTKHIYQVPDVCSPILVMQPLLGALVCFVTGGFSFTTLRFLTLTLGLAGGMVFYFLMLDFSKNKKLSFLAALLMLAEPLYFNVANSFMTDIPFLCMTLFAIFFFIQYINTSQLKFIILGTVFAICATLIRQFGVVIPLAYGICEFITKRKPFVQKLKYFIPAAIILLVLKVTLLWLKNIGSAPVLSNNTSILDFLKNPKFWSSEVLIRCENVLFYFGLFFLPYLLFIKFDSVKNISSSARAAFIGIIGVISIAFIKFYSGFPSTDIINSGSMGPRTLSDLGLYNIAGHYTDWFSKSTMQFIYFMGNAGAVLLLIHVGTLFIKVIKHVKTIPSLSHLSHKKVFIAFCLAGYLALFLATFDHFDRYMLPLFPMICLVILTEGRTIRLITIPSALFSCIYIFIMLYFSSFATHDYLAWNRARWQAVDYLTKEQHISIHNIDGGYEVNGWLIGIGREINKYKIWGCVDDNTYMISFGEIANCRTIKQFYYKNYFPKATRSIYVLQTKNQ